MVIEPVLIHLPAGRQHPYAPAPFERSPDQPSAGDVVQIGIVARPAQRWRDVWVEWRHAGAESLQRVQATLVQEAIPELTAGEVAAGAAVAVAETVPDAQWQASLPAFVAGAAIEYVICGAHDTGAFRSSPCTFSVAGWQRATLEAVTHTANTLVIDYCLPQREAPVRLTVRASAEQVHLTWGDALDDGIEADAASLLQPEVDDAGRLTIVRAGEALLRMVEAPAFLVGTHGALLRVRHAFASADDEAFYGFGERYNALNQRGEVLDVRVYEQYKGQGKRTYMPVPLLLSSRGYGCYLESRRWASFDLAASRPDCWSFDAELDAQGGLQARVLGARALRHNLTAYAQITGLPAMPPAWSFGLWVSSNDWDSQTHVEEQLAAMRAHDIPASVMVLEAWSDEINFYIWNDAQYTPRAGDDAPRLADFTFPPDGKWRDPKAMIDALHDAGVRLLLWQIPVLKHPTEPHLMGNPQHAADKAHMRAQNFGVQMPNGEPYRVRPPWFRGSMLMDFTNQAACDWWFAKRRYLMDELGVDGFKTDGGEHLWAREARFADGRSGAELWNEYPVEYVRAYWAFMRSVRGDDALLFSRAGYAGAQQYPAHWAGDEISTWEAYRASLLGMLNAGLSGIPFIGWDIAGFSGPIPTAELYLRAAAMSVFCPIMQYHSEYWRGAPARDRTPWNIATCTGDTRVIPFFRKFVQLRERLRPYIEAQAAQCCATGLPLMRALALDFADDLTARDYPLQYLFGEALLVAPITSSDTERAQVYLPAGAWRNVWTGVTHAGAQVVDVAAPLHQIPVFLRDGYADPLNGAWG